jgi:hypothetical protein
MIAAGAIICFGMIAFFVSGIRYRSQKIATKIECDSFMARVHSRLDLQAETERLKKLGLDVDFTPNSQAGDGVLLISSSRLDHGQVSCQLIIASGSLTSVN